MENMYSDKSDKNPYKPFYKMALLGLGLIAFGIFIYFDLKAWENSNEQKYMNSLLWGLYDLGGKLTVSGFFWVIGLALILMGAKKSKELKRLSTNKKK
ncbi:hypothetical protein [Aquimarina algicola]|uniref:Uncharacterized protein n=1 Tax=Aquimarina algicola TaxID=2589995 RepID=A0A504JPK6_9FLAO|nr:hypothetical protein [Aquimarina algicola]TPN88681.1 hypothetical protein FHK87_00265 [Aquimarina algicola]